MENTVLEVKHLAWLASTGLPRAKLAEIFSSARYHIFEQLKDDGAFGLAADGDVEVDARIFDWGKFLGRHYFKINW